MGISNRADKILSLWVNLFLSAPITAVIPALMPILGIGDATVIATVILFSIWVVIIDTQAGVTHVKDSLVEMGGSLDVHVGKSFSEFHRLCLKSYRYSSFSSKSC